MTIGNRITTLRKELQISQEEMAFKIGVTRQSVSKWETDTSAPDAFNLIALAEILNTSVEYIVTGKNVSSESEEKAKSKNSINTSNTNFRSNLSILGFILAIGGILFSIIGMFFHEIWCIIGAYVVATGFICALARKKKYFYILFSIMAVLIVITILLLTL